MRYVNVIAVINKKEDKVLLCERKKNPYKGLFNFVGGKLEPNESHLAGAYRELFEETTISENDISLTHLMDFVYHIDELVVEVYAGILKNDVLIHGEENDLFFSSLQEDFFAVNRYAGEGSTGHIMEIIKLNYHKLKENI